MRVAHSVVITPKRCGLYETTREVVGALRKLGVDSRLVDPTKDKNPLHPTGDADRGTLIGSIDWAVNADVIVNHSGFDGTPLSESTQPVIHVCHARPRHSFIGERDGGTPVYSYQYQRDKDPRFKRVVTFWPEHIEYHKIIFRETPVEFVPAPVDLDYWSPDGPKGYRFGGKAGGVNVVCTDGFRGDIDPFEAMCAFARWSRGRPERKLHVYGKPKKSRGFDVLIKQLAEQGNLGEVRGWVSGLRNAYRAADWTITSHMINTRSVRESLACGCPVARADNCFVLPPRKSREEARKMAEESFNPETTGLRFKALLDEVLAES